MNSRIAVVLSVTIAFGSMAFAQTPVAAPKPLKAAAITGGHDFDQPGFEGMLGRLSPGVECTQLEQKDDSEFLEDISKWDYDVVVLYNMSKNISAKRLANFKALLDKGVGMVVLHHAVANFPQWPEYAELIGARYYLEDSPAHSRSQYKHDVTVPVAIANPDHPITRGIAPFELVDEVYSNYDFLPGGDVLLTTNQPDSAPVLAQAKTARNARLVYIQLGHGPQAFTDTTYQELLRRSILWSVKKLE